MASHSAAWISQYSHIFFASLSLFLIILYYSPGKMSTVFFKKNAQIGIFIFFYFCVFCELIFSGGLWYNFSAASRGWRCVRFMGIKKSLWDLVPEVAAGLFIVGVHEELGFQLTGGLPSGLVDFVVVVAHRVPLSGLVGFPSLSLVL